MITSIDAEKAFNQTQHHFMIQSQKKLGIEAIYLSIIKAIYNKLTASITLNGEKLKSFPQVRNKIRVSTLPTLQTEPFLVTISWTRCGSCYNTGYCA
jgi:hypothetical protein